MKALIQSKTFREVLLFSGLMGAALLLVNLIGPSAFASGLIDPGDNPQVISGATDGASDLKTIIKTILNFFLGFLGFVATIMVIYGGVLYVTSAGNDDNVGKAKKILLYAVVGIIIILISFALINTVLRAASSGIVPGA